MCRTRVRYIRSAAPLPPSPTLWRVSCGVPGILSYPCFVTVDEHSNVIVANSGCDTITVLSRDTGLCVASLPVAQPIGVHLTESSAVLTTSALKHNLVVFS